MFNVLAASAANARVSSAAIAVTFNATCVVLAATAPVKVLSAFWNALTISVNESKAAASVLVCINAMSASFAVTRVSNAVSAAALTPASVLISVAFAASANPARVTSAAKSVVKVEISPLVVAISAASPLVNVVMSPSFAVTRVSSALSAATLAAASVTTAAALVASTP